jgi:hypothetical protein
MIFSLSLWERVRVRGLKIKEFSFFDSLIPGPLSLRSFSQREKEQNA